MPKRIPTPDLFAVAHVPPLVAAGFTIMPATTYLGAHHQHATQTTPHGRVGTRAVSVVASLALATGSITFYRAATLYHAPVAGGTATTPGAMGTWGTFAAALALATTMAANPN